MTTHTTIERKQEQNQHKQQYDNKINHETNVREACAGDGGAADGGSGDYDGNELKGVDYETAQDANTTYYVLSKVNGVFGFYKLKNTVNLGANKAYLAVATPPSLAPAYFGFDEGTTNILNTDFTDNTDKAGAIYDLQGRKIANGQKPNAKGLYIVNGRKFIIK